jgi:hypothetical protein
VGHVFGHTVDQDVDKFVPGALCINMDLYIIVGESQAFAVLVLDCDLEFLVEQLPAEFKILTIDQTS